MVRALALLVGVLTGCFSPSPPSGLPCSADNECPEGQSCDLLTRLCDGIAPVDPDERVWTDDSAADFSAGKYLAEVAIEPGGFAGPAAFFTGALRTTGYPGQLVGNPATATFENIVANQAAGSGFARGWKIEYGIRAPFGVGLPTTNIDNVTVVFEGEIELDVPGNWEFQLTADDAGFIDIAPPGGSFSRLINDNFNGTKSGVIPISTPGWYRFRGAFDDTGGGMLMNFQIDSPQINGGPKVVELGQMRVRVDDLAGVVIDGFDDPQDIIYFGSTRATQLDQAYGTDPFSIPIGFGALSVRSSGQVLIDAEGDYQFTIDSVHGHRMWIDNQKMADAMSAQAEITITDPIHLIPGWHDLVVDVQKSGGTEEPRLALSIASGGAPGPIASDHLRPVVARSQQFAAGQSSIPVPINDGATASRTVNVTFPPGFVTEEIQFGIEVEHDMLSTIHVDLDPPGGAPMVVAAQGSLADDGIEYIGASVSPSVAGGAWLFSATDPVLPDLKAGRIVKCGVTHFGRGGLAPFATSYRFESRVFELGDVRELGVMGWRLRQGEPSAAAMQLRTCDTADSCDAEAWTDVALGTVPGVPLRRFAQYGATVSTDGDVPTALDVVELRYVVAP